MAMVCPNCNSIHEQRLQCPLCGGRLLFHEGRPVEDRSSPRPAHWRQRPWGRICVGLVLAQGLFYALRHLLTAVLMATQGSEGVEQLWATASGVLLFQVVRIAALLVGAVFAGAGQRQGGFLGAMVGAWCGVFSVLLLPGPTQALTPIALLGQPLLQAAIGGVGGWLGSIFWKPVPTVSSDSHVVPTGQTLSQRKRDFLRRNLSLFSGPVYWFRVGVGAALAVAGTLTATIVFEKMLDLSHGALATTDDIQDRLITLEIKALALLLGGALAGATTRNGLKQGFCVGLATTVILIGVEMNFVERWLQMAGLTIVGAFSLSLVGGWFGSQLFPPIVKAPRDRGLSRASL